MARNFPTLLHPQLFLTLLGKVVDDGVDFKLSIDGNFGSILFKNPLKVIDCLLGGKLAEISIETPEEDRVNF